MESEKKVSFICKVISTALLLGAVTLFVTSRYVTLPPVWMPLTVLMVLGAGVAYAWKSSLKETEDPTTPAVSKPALAQSGTVESAHPTPGFGSVGRPDLSFSDIAGLDDVLGDLKELVDYVGEREKYLALDAKLPRGVLLYGPPGTGKTLLAKALAAEANANFLYASGSSFVEKYVGVGAQRVRELFGRAREESPSVIFIDEIDSIGKSRGSGESAEWDTALNQLLTELDGFNSSDNVLLVCATNRKEMLDEALLRPGRLDRQIYIGLPDMKAREAILQTHTRKKPLAAEVDLAALARRTPGFSGAHLAAAANEAALACVRAGRTEITMADFDGALDRVMAGQTGRPNVLSEGERRLVAYHEAGHAVTGWALGQGAIEKITLLSRSQALGYVLQVPEERSLQSRSDLKARIAMLLGGRAAEEYIIGDISTGASDDLRKATGIAERMVTEFGMGDRHPHQAIREQSLVFSRTVSREVDKIIHEGWAKAQQLVRQHDAELRALAEALLEHEVLTREDVERILGVLPKAS